ncbi:GPO family capsid scaffolding protein [Diaphorobacter sp. HDW4A]|uniref:GPO family capsid scaffolding protein n=1 Tax=Diaphorobacter sp. HDW4A TaxID=2714924 RepID=UPI0014089F50|nr:GPO family capsid scaffolding protein [Diaphorobacter sp. HDW4A]QIL80831.1 GPO family capsid scaffolding protein [Diaphorobacter sp. HDW4A]QIL83573.1 GPO family capsid scaffolding protein [Diaphorobacter sp. HDW4A]
MAKKFFRVAVEGATIDGRSIKRAWLTQAAANYDPEVYGARVWVEHMRSYSADSPFSAQGDVIELKAEVIKGGKLDGKMALYAAIAPLDDLVKLNKRGKKVYSSAEIVPEFADTGEAYMTGVAVTDEPASLGTETLKFSAEKDKKRFSSGFIATELDYGDEEEDDDDDDDTRPEPAAKRASVLSKVLGKFRKLNGRQEDTEKFSAQAAEVMEETAESVEDLQGRVDKLESENKALNKKFTKLQAALDDQTEKLSKQDGSGTKRPAATGSETSDAVADC